MRLGEKKSYVGGSIECYSKDATCTKLNLTIPAVRILFTETTGGTILLSPSSAMLHIGTVEYDPISQPHRANGTNSC